jgi:hypothetical protein
MHYLLASFPRRRMSTLYSSLLKHGLQSAAARSMLLARDVYGKSPMKLFSDIVSAITAAACPELAKDVSFVAQCFCELRSGFVPDASGGNNRNNSTVWKIIAEEILHARAGESFSSASQSGTYLAVVQLAVLNCMNSGTPSISAKFVRGDASMSGVGAANARSGDRVTPTSATHWSSVNDAAAPNVAAAPGAAAVMSMKMPSDKSRRVLQDSKPSNVFSFAPGDIKPASQKQVSLSTAVPPAEMMQSDSFRPLSNCATGSKLLSLRNELHTSEPTATNRRPVNDENRPNLAVDVSAITLNGVSDQVPKKVRPRLHVDTTAAAVTPALGSLGSTRATSSSSVYRPVSTFFH